MASPGHLHVARSSPPFFLLKCRSRLPIVQMGAECRRIHKAGDELRGLLFALRIKEQNGRQAEHLQVFQQCHILGAVLGHVYLQQNGPFQGLLYFGRAKGVFSNSLQATHQSAYRSSITGLPFACASAWSSSAMLATRVKARCDCCRATGSPKPSPAADAR